MKRFSSPLWTFSLPILAGLLVSWAVERVTLLEKFERTTFVYPERLQPNSFVAHHPVAGKFVFRVYDVRPRKTPESNLGSYVIDSETKDILGSPDLTPANWTFLINSIREAGASHLAITQSPSWESADEVALRALEHELTQLDSFAVGVDLRRGPQSEDFPEYLEGSVIPSPEGIDEGIPTVNQINPHPSIDAPIYGFSQLEVIEPDEEKVTFKIPLLVRWDDNLLPSLELASLMARLKVSAEDVLYEPGRFIALHGLVIPIDEKGRTSVPFKKIKPLSTSSLLISPEETPSLVTLISESASLQQHQFPLTVQYIGSFGQTIPGILYFRLPYWKEVTFLVLFVLILHRRKWWLTGLAALAYFAFPFLTNEWLLLSPPLAAALTFAGLKIRGPGKHEEESDETRIASEPDQNLSKPEEEPAEDNTPGAGEELTAKKLPTRHSSAKRQPTSSRDRLAKKKRSH